MTIAAPLALTDEIVVLRRATYDALMAAVEDALDARALADLRAREAVGAAEYVPIERADRIAAGEHPVRAWREHRGLTLGALAGSAGIAPSYLSEIEAGSRTSERGASPAWTRSGCPEIVIASLRTTDVEAVLFLDQTPQIRDERLATTPLADKLPATPTVA